MAGHKPHLRSERSSQQLLWSVEEPLSTYLALGLPALQWDICTAGIGRKLANPGEQITSMSDQLSLNGVHHRFQTIVSAQFLIDVMEMIAKGLGADVESVRDLLAFFALGEQAENVFLLF